MVKKLFGLGRRKTEGKTDSGNSASQDPTRTSSSSPSSSSSPAVEDLNIRSSSDDDASSRVSSSIQSSSIFSKSRLTYNTGGSSTRTGSSHGKSRKEEEPNLHDNDNVGKPLRVLDFGRISSLNPVMEEEEASIAKSETALQGGIFNEEVSSSAQRTSSNHNLYARKAPEKIIITVDQVENELRLLDENLVSLMDDIHQNVTNISKAVIQAIEYFKKFLPEAAFAKVPYKVSMNKSSSLRRITKVVLHFTDNLLMSDVFNNSRAILVKRFMEFLKKLNINPIEDNYDSHTLPCPKNFCIDEDCDLPNKEKISLIIEEIARADSASISDQDGAFIAPVLRGLSKVSAVLTVLFGLPNPQHGHYEMVKALYSLFPDVHFYCVKDYIKPCADILPSRAKPKPMENKTVPQFIPPYRLVTDSTKPPISMSLSSEQSKNITGTLGGYIYPQIEKSDTTLSQFTGSTFAITCAHVVLSESQDYPHVAVPSTVLQKQYKKAILEESQRYAQNSPERCAFEAEVTRIDQNLQWQDENQFGQVVWGERSIINQRLSDFAIIKVNPLLNCMNYLGDDVSTLADPTLRFQNLYVKEKVLQLKAGMEVFKIGATTKYTSGRINGSKLVYWADGKIQSSEFVISSPSPFFATGGDSGAWILTKLPGRLGLGVVGMLHSYDGEQKQFGLFSSIGDILERLHDVTGVLWDIDKPVDN
ncbi:LAFE_0G04852g1_1 [Lachancea fermentati]|uniref:SPS-sensor serine protease component SSY5 n=1 Tax=Lachancea fermentati TaxID=4955 RepID=A0A1G4MHE4_LACFM|nr:LAFE_0G04852g1_1 [Lachancea fermentati]